MRFTAASVRHPLTHDATNSASKTKEAGGDSLAATNLPDRDIDVPPECVRDRAVDREWIERLKVAAPKGAAR
jgi:hypothetical protein